MYTVCITLPLPRMANINVVENNTRSLMETKDPCVSQKYLIYKTIYSTKKMRISYNLLFLNNPPYFIYRYICK